MCIHTDNSKHHVSTYLSVMNCVYENEYKLYACEIL